MSGRLKYRRDIEGLRALAVISVIVNHFNEGFLPSGYLGVDVFFVISGFVITGSLYNSSYKNFIDLFLSFYSRRFKRLVPPLILFTLITSLLICLFSSEPKRSLHTGFSSLFGFSNIFLWLKSAEYFQPSVKLNAFTHTWSLGVEEQFYFFFPLIIWFCGFNRQTKKGGTKFLWTVGFLSIVSLCLFVYLNLTNELAAFYLMPARFWEIGAGCLAFFLSTRIPVDKLFYKIPALTILIALLVTLFAPHEWRVIAPIAITLLTTILILSVRRNTTAYSILTNRAAVYVGTISYSLYLWHWSVLAISRWTIGIDLTTAPFLLVLMFIFSGASYRFIESPIRNNEWPSTQLKTIFWGLGSSVLTSLFVLLMSSANGGGIYLGTRHPQTEKITSSKVLLDYEEIAKPDEEIFKTCNMQPHLLTGESYRPPPNVDKAFIDNCIQGQDGSKKVLLIGDSFAASSLKHLSAIAHDIGYDFRAIFGYSCPYPIPYEEIEGAGRRKCPNDNMKVSEKKFEEEIINSLSSGDLLVLRLDFPKQGYLSYKNSKLPPLEAYDNGLIKLSKGVSIKGAKLLVIGANPILTFQQRQHLRNPQWFNFSSNSSDYSLMAPDNNLETKYFHALDSHLVQLFKSLDNSEYFSVKPYICGPQDICKIKDEEVLLYFDSYHLTPYAYDLFFTDLSSRVKNLVFTENEFDKTVDNSRSVFKPLGSNL